MTHSLLQQLNTQPRFRWDITLQQAEVLLESAYRAHVISRHNDFVSDDEVKSNIRRIAECLTSDKPKMGIMLCGTCGNGKTSLLYAIKMATEVLNEWGQWERKYDVKVVDAKYIQAYFKTTEDRKSLFNSDILAIEDMGREATEIAEYGNLYSPVIDLLEHRYNRQLTTLITTNLTATQIREKYKDRIADRFNEMLNVIVFKNQSYRR